MVLFQKICTEVDLLDIAIISSKFGVLYIDLKQIIGPHHQMRDTEKNDNFVVIIFYRRCSIVIFFDHFSFFSTCLKSTFYCIKLMAMAIDVICAMYVNFNSIGDYILL